MTEKAPTGTDTEKKFYESIGGAEQMDRWRYELAQATINLINLSTEKDGF